MSTVTDRSGFDSTLLLPSRNVNSSRLWPQVSSPGLAMIRGYIGGVVAGGCQSGRLPGSGALLHWPGAAVLATTVGPREATPQPAPSAALSLRPTIGRR